MKQDRHLVISLPEALADLPIRIVRNSNCDELAINVLPTGADAARAGSPRKRHVLIWRQNDYVRVALDEIEWIEADGSYSIVHLTERRDMTVSFNLAVVEKALPGTCFVRIHRSTIVNLVHIESLAGNSVRVGKALLGIGREYRSAFLDRFIFLGIRRSGRWTAAVRGE